ncbi:MAG: hypothetical protein ACOYN0_17765 [Phycisphaerales bacterium]
MDISNRSNYTAPAPASVASGNFALNAVATVAGAGLNVVAPGLGTFANALAGGKSGADIDLGEASREFGSLLRLQMQVQQMSTRFQSETNIAKTAHESQMAAVRNIKA